MGAIWNFLSGRSTDWDEVEAQDAERERNRSEWEDEHPKARKKYYTAYCRVCGLSTTDRLSSPGSAIRDLQIGCCGNSNSGCGSGNHSPEVQEVYD